jgi:hypothetical protein
VQVKKMGECTGENFGVLNDLKKCLGYVSEISKSKKLPVVFPILLFIFLNLNEDFRISIINILSQFFEKNWSTVIGYLISTIIIPVIGGYTLLWMQNRSFADHIQIEKALDQFSDVIKRFFSVLEEKGIMKRDDLINEILKSDIYLTSPYGEARGKNKKYIGYGDQFESFLNELVKNKEIEILSNCKYNKNYIIKLNNKIKFEDYRNKFINFLNQNNKKSQGVKIIFTQLYDKEQIKDLDISEELINKELREQIRVYKIKIAYLLESVGFSDAVIKKFENEIEPKIIEKFSKIKTMDKEKYFSDLMSMSDFSEKLEEYLKEIDKDFYNQIISDQKNHNNLIKLIKEMQAKIFI